MNSSSLDAEHAWQRLLSVRTTAQAEAAGLWQQSDGQWRWRGRATASAHRIAALYTPLCLAGPGLAFAQLGQSMDGFIATRTGHSDYVTGEEDRLHLHRLRALADAVVVGAGTAVSDDPQLTVRACRGSNPVRVVLDPRGRVAERAPRARMFTDGRAPTLRIVAAHHANGAADPDSTLALAKPTGGFEPREVLAALADRGLRRVLVEGGGVTVSRFLQAGALDLLYLTVAPVLLGDGVPGLRFPGPTRMDGARRPAVRVFPLGQDTLFATDLRNGPAAKELS